MTPLKQLAISIGLSVLAIVLGGVLLCVATGCDVEVVEVEAECAKPIPTHAEMVELLERECLVYEWDDAAFAECVGYGLIVDFVHGSLWNYHNGGDEYQTVEHLASDLLITIHWLRGED